MRIAKTYYEPSRLYSHMTVSLSVEIRMVYENSRGKMVVLKPDGSLNNLDMIRRVWNLITMDMNRSNLPIYFILENGRYEMYYHRGMFQITNMLGTGEYMARIPRPPTPFHVHKMIEGQMSFVQAAEKIKMTETTRNAWIAKRSWVI